MLTNVAIIAPTVENRLFANKMLDVLLNPASWTVIRSSDAAAARESEAESECHIDVHAHVHREILVILDGVGPFAAHGRVWDCHPGMIFLLNSMEPHQLGYAPEQPNGDHLWVFLHDHLIGYQVERIRRGGVKRAGHLLYTDRTSASFIESIFGSPGAEFPEQFRQMEARAGLIALITAVVKEGYLVPVKEDTRSFQKRVVLTVRDHILETAGKGASLDSLARISGYSKYHFLRLFREHVGMTVHEFIDHSRSEKVAEMQRQGRRKKEIAAALGFSSLSAFSRWEKHLPE